MAISKGVALVTGASQGIGRAIALRLASDGFDVALNDIPSHEAMLATTAEEVASRGPRVHCVLADVSSEKQVETMVSDVINVFGGLDVVCTESLPHSDTRNEPYQLTMLALTDGCKCRYLYDEKFCRQFVWHPFASWRALAKTSPSSATAEDLDRILGVNVRGTFLCYKYAAIQMIAQGRGGRIIGMPSMPLPVLRCSLWLGHYRTGACSGTGKQGQASLSAYTASKFSIRGLTQSAGESDPPPCPVPMLFAY